MTHDASGADSSSISDEQAAGDIDAGDIDAAERAELEDDAERTRQRNRSALIGLVGLILVIVLAVVGFYFVATAPAAPLDPEIVRQLPPPTSP